MIHTQPPAAPQPATPPHVADAGRIALGAGFRLPTEPAHVADHGKVSVGAGFRLATERKPA